MIFFSFLCVVCAVHARTCIYVCLHNKTLNREKVSSSCPNICVKLRSIRFYYYRKRLKCLYQNMVQWVINVFRITMTTWDFAAVNRPFSTKYMNILLTIVYWSDAAQMSHSLFMQIEWDNYNQCARGQFSIRVRVALRCRCQFNAHEPPVTTLRLNVLVSTEE